MIKGSIENTNDQAEYTVYTGCYSAKTKTYYCNYENDFELKKYQLDEPKMTSSNLTIG